jgi:ABC-type oligopeptide transport system ATPase subunit
MSVADIVGEPLKIHDAAQGSGLSDRVVQLLKSVGLQGDHLRRYPHSFSGGQRQRIGIARSLALNPKLIVCDEPVSALDVSIQAQVVNLLEDLQAQHGLAYLFISHDLGVVYQISDRVAVMYVGKMVELAKTEELFKHPLHPTPRCCFRPCPCPTRASAATASCYRARWRTRPIRRQAVIFIPAVSMQRTSANTKRHRSGRSNPNTSSVATSPKSCTCAGRLHNIKATEGSRLR